MFKMFKKNKEKLEKSGEDSTIAAKDLTGDGAGEEVGEVKTTLSFHPDANVGPEEKYYFQFLNNELPLLKPNQLSISGIDVKQNDDSIIITAFIRNSLSKAVRLSDSPLLFVGPDDEIIGRKVFPLGELGELPAQSSRPWEFVFTPKDLLKTEFPQTGWKLAFELNKPHSLDLEETWKNNLSEADQQKLDNLVKQMDPPKKGEINFMGLQANKAGNGDLHVTLLIRNGNEKNITLQQLPLVVEDASGEVIAQGGFKLDDLEVKANTSKPWTFVFPASLVTKEEIDFSTWKAYPPKQ
ncbi:accessory Sec system S-layer assembly protein [Oikeobacillus pervagus]|nr:accessory Sec system S-layer assembly protein [Oikeobacillus pervagus]